MCENNNETVDNELIKPVTLECPLGINLEQKWTTFTK